MVKKRQAKYSFSSIYENVEIYGYVDEKSDIVTQENLALIARKIGKVNQQKDNHDIWIADSGASIHITNSPTGMYDMMDCQVKIIIGYGSEHTAISKGKKKLMIMQSAGDHVVITLNEVY